MKKLYSTVAKKLLVLSLFGTISISSALAQAPSAFKYQSVVRDAAGATITNQNVSFEISIVQTTAGGSSVYTETHTVTTSSTGVANLSIGAGTVTTGDFSSIDWGADDYFIKVSFDENGGSNFTEMGTSQLLSVPYALHANTVENDMVDDADADPSNEIQDISLSGTNLSISSGSTIDLSSLQDGFEANTDEQTLSLSGSTITISGGNSITLPSGTIDTDDQTLSLSGTALSIADGNTVDLSSLQDGFEANTDEQTISLNGNNLSISGGNSVDLSGIDTDTDNQNLSLSGTELSIANGNMVDLAAIQDGYEANTDEQTISLSGTNLSISSGNTVDLSSIDTDNQNLSLSGTELSIANGNMVDLAAIQDGTGTDSQTLTLNGSTLSISGGNNVDISTAGINPLPIESTSSATTLGTESGMVRITAAVTVTLPAIPTHGQILYIVGGTGNSAIHPNGKSFKDGVNFLDANSSHTFTSLTGNNGGVVTIMYTGFNWVVVSKN